MIKLENFQMVVFDSILSINPSLLWEQPSSFSFQKPVLEILQQKMSVFPFENRQRKPHPD
jgi:hypothetical protein